jgi:hypothetical protein
MARGGHVSCLDLVLVGCFAFEIVRLATVDLSSDSDLLDCSFPFHLGSSRDMTQGWRSDKNSDEHSTPWWLSFHFNNNYLYKMITCT